VRGLKQGAPNDSHPSDGGGDTGETGGAIGQRIQLINEYRRMAGEVPRRLCVACRWRYGAMVQAIAIGGVSGAVVNLPIPRKPLPSKAHSPIPRCIRSLLRVLYTYARLDPLHPPLLLLERILMRGHTRWALVKSL